MKLADYLTANGLTPAAFAEKIGVHRGTVCRYIKPPEPGKPVFGPSRKMVAKINAATNGQVTANDFADTTDELPDDNAPEADDPSGSDADDALGAAALTHTPEVAA